MFSLIDSNSTQCGRAGQVFGITSPSEPARVLSSVFLLCLRPVALAIGFHIFPNWPIQLVSLPPSSSSGFLLARILARVRSFQPSYWSTAEEQKLPIPLSAFRKMHGLTEYYPVQAVKNSLAMVWCKFQPIKRNACGEARTKPSQKHPFLPLKGLRDTIVHFIFARLIFHYSIFN